MPKNADRAWVRRLIRAKTDPLEDLYDELEERLWHLESRISALEVPPDDAPPFEPDEPDEPEEPDIPTQPYPDQLDPELIQPVGNLHGVHPSNMGYECLLDNVVFGNGVQGWSYDVAPQWPEYEGGVNGNVWVVAMLDGKWYAATFEWVRIGQTDKSLTLREFPQHIKEGPLANWVPIPGEPVYFFVSSCTRAGAWRNLGPATRTNIVKVTWV